MAGEQLFTATGEIVEGNEVIEATARGTTKARAQFRLFKKLCNKLRFRDTSDAYVWWPQLSVLQQEEWLAKVSAKLSWTEITPRTSKLDAESFRGALEGGWY